MLIPHRHSTYHHPIQPPTTCVRCEGNQNILPDTGEVLASCGRCQGSGFEPDLWRQFVIWLSHRRNPGSCYP